MEKTHIAVLGGGLVGGFIARQLAAEPRFQVTLYDHSREVLERCAIGATLQTKQAELDQQAAVHRAASAADIVVGALPGHLGFRALTEVIESGKNTVDISFFPEDALSLRAKAEQHEVVAVVDCGVMPGLGGMLALHMAAQIARPERMTIMVGGLPVERRWPLEYKAPFSPIDVIEEYTRPARLVEGGNLVTRPALSDVELVDLPGVGTLEAFNTDGLRTLISSLPLQSMREKTLRYPGHAEKIRLLQVLGFFGTEPLALGGTGLSAGQLVDGHGVPSHQQVVDGHGVPSHQQVVDGRGVPSHQQMVRPIDLTSALLTSDWRLKPGERELTVMRVEVEGRSAHGSRELRRADLLDRTDEESGALSMARTTGLPAVIATRMLADGQLSTPGLLPAELLGQDEALFDIMLDTLVDAGIEIRFEVIEL